MSEENLFEIDSVDQEASVADGMAGETEIVDFDQNGLLLKIATDGIAIQDYVKRLKESDILVAVDGELYLDGTAKLNDKFMMEAGDEAKWLLTFWRDGQLFDILLRAPIQSQFGLATEQARREGRKVGATGEVFGSLWGSIFVGGCLLIRDLASVRKKLSLEVFDLSIGAWHC